MAGCSSRKRHDADRVARGWVMTLAGLWVLAGLAIASDKPGESARSKLQELRKQCSAAKGKVEPAAGLSQDRTDVSYIDKLLEQEWKALGFQPAEPCTDGEFLRRASLDLIGRIPTYDETLAYFQEKAADRRHKLIERLLASDEYGKNWANIWTNLMITDGRAGGNNQDINPDGLRAWLEKEFNRNTPWNQMVTELISSRGRWDENGAVNFVIANINTEMNRKTTKTTAYVTRLFLCVQTQCTECHDHPWNEWKQDQFHGMDAFFAGTRSRRVTRTSDNGQVATDYYVLEEVPFQQLRDKGTFFERRNGLTVFTGPTYLDGRDVLTLMRGTQSQAAAEGTGVDPAVVLGLTGPASSSGPIYLREELARVITAGDNPYFARAIINRLWYHYMGHSFTKNVDDFDNGQDEPTMPELLERLSEDFRQSGYDLKRLTKWICSSKAYALSSRHRGKENEEAIGFFTTVLVKPMTPEQLYDSVLTLTQVHKAGKAPDTSAQRQAFLREFLNTFGTDEMQTGAPKYVGTITQALMLMNSRLMTDATSCLPGTFLHRIATDPKLNDMEKVEAIYMAAFCRKPTQSERREAARFFQGARTPQAKQEALSDVLWVVLNTGEFILNH